ncbi:MAG: hypothetical protein JWL72_1068 [Ilumatobacteraceae bacterium]|nr:hypothetical protein [Ilumatobacteraceae bacterium]MCU1387730.1 hypothetical protein [Ilumatobacteraceae bacterium]
MPHDAPSAQEMLAAVREWMERDLLAGTDGRLHFHTRVAINVLAMVERELELGPTQAIDHAERLAGLGFDDDRALAAAIRSGAVDDHPALAAHVRGEVLASVLDKLRVANPKYLIDGRG